MQEKHILILGSGHISEPIIDHLLQREDNLLTICSNNQNELRRLIEKKTEKEKISENKIKVYLIDVVEESEKLYNFIHQSDLVISVIPAFLLIYVVKACLKVGRNLISTSYITDNIKKMENEIKERNLIFMLESGVNPGLDHIIANKVIREETTKGGTILGYESWVGAVPSPENADNPLLYKFSWSPKGALLAMKNEARQLINGKIIKISEKNLFTNYLVDKRFHPSLNLEGYYNRDSLKYIDLYNLKQAKSVIRGIIRYQGFTYIIQCFKFLNLFSFEKPDKKNWRDHLNKLLKNPRIQDIIFDVKDKYIKKGQETVIYNISTSDSIAERLFYFNLSLLAISYFDDKYIRKYSFDTLFNRIYSALIFLNFYDEDNIFLSKESLLDALSKLLEQKISMKDWERDMIYMQNEFKIRLKNNSILYKKYDLLVFGGHNNLPYTATALLVGKPAAIIAQLILDNKIEERGLLIPSSDIIIKKVLEELEKIKIFVLEKIEIKAKF